MNTATSTSRGIKCGHCPNRHETVSQVRDCATISQHDPYAGVKVATREKFNRLQPAKGHVVRAADPFGMDEFDAEIQRREREEEARVAEYKAQRDVIPAQRRPMEPQTGLPKRHTATYPGSEYGHEPHTRGYEAERSWGREKAIGLADGIYRNPQTGDIFKVYHTVHGANQQVAKRLAMLDDPFTKISRGKEVLVKAEFIYEGKKGLRGLTPDMQMTLEEAKKYGAIYGVCLSCAATLTREESIERAMGPVCAGKANWAA